MCLYISPRRAFSSTQLKYKSSENYCGILVVLLLSSKCSEKSDYDLCRRKTAVCGELHNIHNPVTSSLQVLCHDRYKDRFLTPSQQSIICLRTVSVLCHGCVDTDSLLLLVLVPVEQMSFVNTPPPSLFLWPQSCWRSFGFAAVTKGNKVERLWRDLLKRERSRSRAKFKVVHPKQNPGGWPVINVQQGSK